MLKNQPGSIHSLRDGSLVIPNILDNQKSNEKCSNQIRKTHDLQLGNYHHAQYGSSQHQEVDYQ